MTDAPDDAARWDAKYASGFGVPLRAPDAGVVRALDRLADEGVPPGRALDLAAGTGRHTLELLARGYRTEAWDASSVGLAILAREALAAGRQVATRVVDLVRGRGLHPDEPGEPFDLVLLVNFLDRPSFARLPPLVRPGGHLIFTTATLDRAGDRPPDAFCLERNELARGLAGFETVATHEEGGRALFLGVRRP